MRYAPFGELIMKQIHEARPPLAFIAPGSDVRLCEIDEAIDPAQQEQLLAYGLSQHCQLRVLQQHPMTPVFANKIDLARGSAALPGIYGWNKK